MSHVRIDRVTLHAPAGQGPEAAERQARRVAELLGKALAEGDAVLSRGRIVVEIPGEPSMPAERIAELAARQLMRRLS